MKVLNLVEGYKSHVYTSNVYLITGDFNSIPDVNTLIDAGRDPSIISKIKNASTGVGKKRVEQLILTHSHYDHVGMLGEIKKEFNPIVMAFSNSIDGIDVILKDGEVIKAGDSSFEVIYMPGHSNDSILLYDKKNQILFAGDSPLIIKSTGNSYEDEFIRVFERVCSLKIRIIYFGHGEALDRDVEAVLKKSLSMLKN